MRTPRICRFKPLARQTARVHARRLRRGAGGGALWVATALFFQPEAYFRPLWTAYMIFMALVGRGGDYRYGPPLRHRDLVGRRRRLVSCRARRDGAGFRARLCHRGICGAGSRTAPRFSSCRSDTASEFSRARTMRRRPARPTAAQRTKDQRSTRRTGNGRHQ